MMVRKVGVAERSHAVLFDVIAAEVHEGEIHESPNGDVCSLVYLSLSAVYAELPGHRAVQPAVGHIRFNRTQNYFSRFLKQ